MIYLKLGFGAPWAAQGKDSEECRDDMIFSVAADENLGADPPTGSL